MTTISFFGCSACCGPYDFDYPTYGGIHHRANPSFGRVGSPFSDPNWAGSGPSADSNLDPHPEPQVQQDLGSDDEPLEGDDDLERVDEDLDDDLEDLDDDLEEMDRRLEELDRKNDGLDTIDEELDPELDDDLELESIQPLEDVRLRRRNRNQAKSRQRRRGALPQRTNSLR